METLAAGETVLGATGLGWTMAGGTGGWASDAAACLHLPLPFFQKFHVADVHGYVQVIVPVASLDHLVWELRCQPRGQCGHTFGGNDIYLALTGDTFQQGGKGVGRKVRVSVSVPVADDSGPLQVLWVHKGETARTHFPIQGGVES